MMHLVIECPRVVTEGVGENAQLVDHLGNHGEGWWIGNTIRDSGWGYVGVKDAALASTLDFKFVPETWEYTTIKLYRDFILHPELLEILRSDGKPCVRCGPDPERFFDVSRCDALYNQTIHPMGETRLYDERYRVPEEHHVFWFITPWPEIRVKELLGLALHMTDGGGNIVRQVSRGPEGLDEKSHYIRRTCDQVRYTLRELCEAPRSQVEAELALHALELP